jgi:iron complex transport system ATP-binding protein
MTEQQHLYKTQSLDVSIGKIRIVQNFNLELRRGECWCLLGKNGVGKTTLLKTLAGLLPPEKGVLQLQEKLLSSLSPKKIAQHIGFLFQEHHDAFPATVMETVLAGRHPHLHAWQWETADDTRLAEQALEFVNLESFAQRTLDTLSGGERRRVGIATLLSQSPDLFLMDEPGNHLDLHQQTSLMQRLCAYIRDSNRVLLMTIHDINLAARLADHCILLMGDGRVIQGSAAAVMTTENLQQLYGHPLEKLQSKAGPVWIPA